MVLLKGVQIQFLYECLAGQNQAGLQAHRQAAGLGTTCSFDVWSFGFVIPRAEERTPLSPNNLSLGRSCHQTSAPSSSPQASYQDPPVWRRAYSAAPNQLSEGLSGTVPMWNKMQFVTFGSEQGFSVTCLCINTGSINRGPHAWSGKKEAVKVGHIPNS